MQVILRIKKVEIIDLTKYKKYKKSIIYMYDNM